MRQLQFQKTKWEHRFSYGGTLRKKRRGRAERPLSTKEPIHLVLKANSEKIRGGFRSPRRFRLITRLSQKYSARFQIEIEQMSIQGDHIHMLVRISCRSRLHHFLRVFAGQTAQEFGIKGLLSEPVVATAGVVSAPRAQINVAGATPTRCRAAAKNKNVTDTPCSARKLWKHRPGKTEGSQWILARAQR